METGKILIVDTNRQEAAQLAETLLPGLGYQTLVRHDGATALQAAREHLIALILLEPALPDMSGLDLLRRLAGEGLRLPAILIAPPETEPIDSDALLLGIEARLSRPLDSNMLASALSSALAGTRLRQEIDGLKEQLSSQVSWLTALSQVGRSVTSTLELDEVLRRIVEAGVLLTQSDEGFLALLDEESGQLNLRAAKNLAEEQSRSMYLPMRDALIGKVLRTGKPARLTRAGRRAGAGEGAVEPVQSLLHVPLLSRGRVLGVLSVANISTRRTFTQAEEARLASLADYATVAIENARLYARLQQLAITDELTGLYNRRGLFELGRREVERSVRFGRQLPALMIDIDHFKQVNDAFGHAAGDQVLRVVAERLRRNVREIDIVGRYGGEEFVILLLENDLESACHVAERLRQLVSTIPVQTERGDIFVTTSMGIAVVTEDVRDLPTLLQRADEALFVAKSSGRNCIAVAQERLSG